MTRKAYNHKQISQRLNNLKESGEMIICHPLDNGEFIPTANLPPEYFSFAEQNINILQMLVLSHMIPNIKMHNENSPALPPHTYL